jgi:predicted anti-sigma-YlaC factor YlaD
VDAKTLEGGGFYMNHIPLGEWKSFAIDEMNSEKRFLYEQHLYTCDQCMDLYMKAIELIQDKIPTIEEPSIYTNEVMSQIPFDQAKKNPIIHKEQEIKKRWYEEKVFHYVLATAMTFLLMATGVFSDLTNVTSQFEKNSLSQNQSSFTENVLNKTTALLDHVEQSEKEEGDLYE